MEKRLGDGFMKGRRGGPKSCRSWRIGDMHDVQSPLAQPARSALLILAALVLAGCTTSTKKPGTTVVEQTTRSPVAEPDSLESVEPSELDTADGKASAETKRTRGKKNECDRPEASNDIGRVGDMQEVLEETTCSAALWLDGLFGEDRNVESAQKTSGFVEASTAYSEFDGSDSKLRFRVRFKLPNLKERFNLIVGRDDEEEFTRDRTERFAVRSQLRNFEEDSEFLAGLGYSLPGTERFSSDFRIGASNLTNPRLFIQQPTRYVLYTDPEDLVYVRGTPFWTNQDGFGFTSGINYNHVLGPKFLLRLTEVGTISEKTEGYDWYTGAIVYQNLRKERALSYQLFVRGATDEPEPLAEYGSRVVYRHPLIPRSLNAELLAGYTWPREDPDLKREGSAEVGLSLEVPFGRRDR